MVILYGLSANVLTEKVSESLLKVQNVRQLTTKIRQEVFQKECFLLDLFSL